MHENELNGKSGNFGDEDTAKGVGEGCVDTNKGEGGVVLDILVEFDTEGLGWVLVKTLNWELMT